MKTEITFDHPTGKSEFSMVITFSDLNDDDVEVIRQRASKPRTELEATLTSNSILAALEVFCTWLVKAHGGNPIGIIEKIRGAVYPAVVFKHSIFLHPESERPRLEREIGTTIKKHSDSFKEEC